jgi:MFS family permease
MRQVITQMSLLTGALLFSIFIYIERRTSYPIINLQLFKVRAFGVGNLTNFLNGLTFGGLAFTIALYYQLVMGFNPEQAGLALIPLDLTLLFIGPLSGRLSDRFGARWLSSVGLAITGVACLMFAYIGTASPELAVIGALAVAGFGIGFFRSPNASSVMGSVPPTHRGVAAGVRSTIINTSLVISVPLVSLLMTATMSYDDFSTLIETSNPSPAQMMTFIAAMKFTFLVFAAINFIAAIISPLRGDARRPVPALPE